MVKLLILLIVVLLVLYGTAFGGLNCGTDAAITTVAKQFDTSTGASLYYVVQADPDNGAAIFVGTSASQPLQMAAGDNWNPRQIDSRDLYAKSASGTQAVNFCGFTP